MLILELYNSKYGMVIRLQIFMGTAARSSNPADSGNTFGTFTVRIGRVQRLFDFRARQHTHTNLSKCPAMQRVGYKHLPRTALIRLRCDRQLAAIIKRDVAPICCFGPVVGKRH